MSSTTLLLVIIALMAAIIAVIYIIRKSGKKDDVFLLLHSQIDAMRGQLQQSLEIGNQNINQQISNITKLFIDTIGHINSQISDQMKSISEGVSHRLRENIDIINQTQTSVGGRLDNASRIMSDLKAKIGEIEESNRQIFQLGKDLTQLQNLLKAPKFRGGLSEYMLSELLAQVLPPECYSLQHNFKSGRVDAVIIFKSGLIPIDAKFPMEGFNRLSQSETEEMTRTAKRQFKGDVKKHIDDIANKYILPEEGTFDFALMYIPAENVYYETIIKDDKHDKSILDYALLQKVIPVSPNSFYAYLQTILLGLRGMKIEQQAKTIIRNLQQLQSNFDKFEGEFQILGKHIANASAKFRDLEGVLSRFGESVLRISVNSSDQGQLDPHEE